MARENLDHNQPEPLKGIPLDKRLFLYDQMARIKPLLTEKQEELRGYTHKNEYEKKKDERPSAAEGSASRIADIIFAKHDQS